MKFKQAKEIVLKLRKAGVACNNVPKCLGRMRYPGENMVIIHSPEGLTSAQKGTVKELLAGFETRLSRGRYEDKLNWQVPDQRQYF